MTNSDFFKRTGYYLAVCVKNFTNLKARNMLLAVLDWSAEDLHEVSRGKNAFAKSMLNKKVAAKSDGTYVWFRTVKDSPYDVRLIPAASLHSGALKSFIDEIARVVPLGVGGCLGNAYVDPANWPRIFKYVEDGAIAIHDEFAGPGEGYYQYLTQLWYR